MIIYLYVYNYNIMRYDTSHCVDSSVGWYVILYRICKKKIKNLKENLWNSTSVWFTQKWKYIRGESNRNLYVYDIRDKNTK